MIVAVAGEGAAMTNCPYEYTTTVEGNLAIAKAISEIIFWEKMEILMPLVAEELKKAGVKFDEVKP